MTWIGRKKIAFIPVFRPNARPPDVIPADWKSDILRRVFDDPDNGTGPDRSLRAYIHAASSGVANFDAVVMPMATIDLQDVRLEFLDGLLDGPGLRNQGFDAAAVVMLGGVGAGTAQRGGFWARFVMAEKLGTWAMELMHVLTGFADIRCQPAFVDCPNGLGDSGSCGIGGAFGVRVLGTALVVILDFTGFRDKGRSGLPLRSLPQNRS